MAESQTESQITEPEETEKQLVRFPPILGDALDILGFLLKFTW